MDSRSKLSVLRTTAVVTLFAFSQLLSVIGEAEARSSAEQLVRAAEAGNLAKVKRLIDRGVPVNSRVDDELNSLTALHRACRKGHKAVARLLLDKGAKVNAWGSKTVFLFTVSGVTPLHEASLAGHMSVVRLLLDHGARINQRDSDGETPLHYAALQKNGSVVRMLIERGADVNARDKNGKTALDAAVRNGHETVIRQLLARGASRDAALDGKPGAYDKHDFSKALEKATKGSESVPKELRDAMQKCRAKTDAIGRKRGKRVITEFSYCRCRNSPSKIVYECGKTMTYAHYFKKLMEAGLTFRIDGLVGANVRIEAKRSCGGCSGKVQVIELLYPRKNR